MNEKIYTEFLDVQDAFLANAFEALLDEIVDDLDVSHPPKVEAKTENEIRTNCRKALSEILYQRENRKSTLRGFDILIETLHRVGGASKACKKELACAGKILIEKIGSKEEIKKSVDAVRNLKEVKDCTIEQALSNIQPFMYDIGISDDSFRTMYDAACWLYSHEEYDNAAAVYRFLIFLNAPCYALWFSMGLCYHKLQNWAQAISAYSMAVVTDATNPWPYINLLKCYKQVGDEENSLYTAKCAKYVVTHSNCNQEEQDKLIQHIKEIREGR